MKNEIFIVGGGSSLDGFDFKLLFNKDTIAVNASIYYTPNTNYFITVDYLFLDRLRIRRRNMFKEMDCEKIFIADFSTGKLENTEKGIVDSFGTIYDLSEYTKIIEAKKSDGIGYSENDFRTGLNSGYCALQLAIILGYTNIYLLGIDMAVTEKAHFHTLYGGRSMRFVSHIDKYLRLFILGLSQLKKERPNINVYSCSKISSLNQFIPYVNIEDILIF